VVLEDLEMAARVEKRGLWADPHPVLPREGREQGATRGGDLRCYWDRYEE